MLLLFSNFIFFENIYSEFSSQNQKVKKWEIPEGIIVMFTTSTAVSSAILKMDEVESICTSGPEKNKIVPDAKVVEETFQEIRKFVKNEWAPKVIKNWMEFYQDKNNQKLKYYVKYILDDKYSIIISGEPQKNLFIYIECEKFTEKNEFKNLCKKFFKSTIEGEIVKKNKEMIKGFELKSYDSNIRIKGVKRYTHLKTQKEPIELYIIRADFKIK